MSSLKEAKRRLVANIGTNVLGVGVSLLIGIWMTPYLIRSLTIEVYGMVPLVISFIQYFNILAMSISGAVSRFVSINLNKKEYEASNKYFNIALFSILIFVAAMAVPIICLANYFPAIFRVPTGFESDTSWMFFYVISASFCIAIACSFQVSTIAERIKEMLQDSKNIRKHLNQRIPEIKDLAMSSGRILQEICQ